MLDRVSVRAISALLTCAGLGASAALGQISSPVLTIQASNQSGTGTIQVDYSRGVWDWQAQTYTWSQYAPLLILDTENGNVVATLSSCWLMVRFDPTYELDVNCGVVAGASETIFTIQSPLVSFPVIDGALSQGRASASVSLTDTTLDGAWLRGLGSPGSGAFKSYLNGDAETGVEFDQLVAYVATSGGTTTASQSDPLFGYRELGFSVNSLTSQTAFTLSPLDIAFATTTLGMLKPAQPECAGDLDGDGEVDVEDMSIFLGAYGACIGEPAYLARADLNGDGCVALVDMVILLSSYGQLCD